LTLQIHFLKTLHVISFDIPYPANYGGAIDVFYKIKALHEKGLKIILHCFLYNNKKIPEELIKYCEEVLYYTREKSVFSWFSFTPFIVQTRNNKALVERLCEDDYPILFEGVHCCYYLSDNRLTHRQKILRSHNIEHQYYKHLAANENSFFKKFYFLSEAWKLQRFENKLQNANYILSISESDRSFFAQRNDAVMLLNAFHANDEVTVYKGLGNYCLFHGNLSIEDNSSAARWLIENVFANNDIEFIIAGKNPNKDLISYCKSFKNVQLVGNPTDAKLIDLISNAQVNVIYSTQGAGVKLKLINVLFQGKHCICNAKTVVGTGLETLVQIAELPAEFINKISSVIKVEYPERDIVLRNEILSKRYNNAKNAGIIMSLL